ncbi:MAG: protease HtpX [Myxococcales bacterium]|nr:protease HtpX [Myxococcales bacterium]
MRTILFVGTNLAILLALALALVVLQALGVLPPMRSQSFIAIIGFALVFGFGGAFIALLMSKRMALMRTGAQIIDTPRSEVERWLLQTVHGHADAAGIDHPDVCIYQSSDMNAFATGARRNDALVAVSSGLLQGMTREEASAVLGHEITHAANGDMVTMTLLQGVLNTFVIVLAQVAANLMSGGDDRRRSGFGGSFLVYMLAQAVLGWCASIIICWFSRWREFRADAGGAELTKPQDMANALRRLKTHEQPDLPASLQAFGIFGLGKSGLAALFATHPPLDVRIARLEAQSRFEGKSFN